MEEKKKGMSPILIVILSIVVICLVGFCVWYGVNYFKGEEKSVEEPSSNVEQSPDSETKNNSCDAIKEPESYIENEKLSSEFKKVESVAYYYYSFFTYCGDGELKVDQDIDNPNDDVHISKQFKSYDELLNYLKKYMSDEVIKQKTYNPINNKDMYYEKDGKLYCRGSEHISSSIYNYKNMNVKIKSLTDKKAETIIIVERIVLEDLETEYFEVTFERTDSNWVITKYNKYKSEYMGEVSCGDDVSIEE